MGRNLSRPTILYVTGFVFCSIVAYIYKVEWGLDKMSSITAYIIVGGAFVFYLLELYDYKKHQINDIKINIESDDFIPIGKLKLVLFFFFQVIVYYLMAQSKMSYAMTDELSEALVEINNETKFENTLVKYPFYVQQPYNLCGAARALWPVLFSYYLFKSKKYFLHKLLIFVNFACAISGTLLSGGRTAILYDIIAFLSFCYICYQFKNGWKGGLLPRKTMIMIASSAVIFSLTFAEIGYAIGRKESEHPLSIIFSIYCGAEIKNLDDYIQHPFKQGNESGLVAQYTFCGMYGKIDQRFKGIDESRKYFPDLRFNEYGSYPLGNVYTTYFNNILDFGYAGTIVWTGFLAWVIALLYRKVLKSSFWSNGRLDLWILFYAINIPAACFLSFFANKLTETFTISGTIRGLLYWWFLIIFFQGRKTYKV